MKLILASSGFTNDEIIQACTELVGKPRDQINFAIINEAIKAEPGDHRWFVESLDEIFDNFPGQIELVDLQAHPFDEVKARLALADVIFCFGGNTDYLTQVFESTGFADYLPELLAEKVWVGSSAGSCVLCHKESKQTTENVFLEHPTSDHYLNLIPIFFLPHYHSDWFKQLNREVALYESRLTEMPVYLMSDQSALKVTGDPGNLQYELIGHDYFVAQRGQKIAEDLQTALAA